MEIRQNELYPENSTLVDKLLHDMATHQILHVGKYSSVVDALLHVNIRDGIASNIIYVHFARILAHIHFAKLFMFFQKKKMKEAERKIGEEKAHYNNYLYTSIHT